MQSTKRVCITGSAGYIGAWVTKAFLDSGKYQVRGTVRDPNNYEKTSALRKALGAHGDELELVEGDLLNQKSLEKAFEGVDYVVHVASPVVMKADNEEDVLGPAVKGTEYVVNACFKNNVKRLVLTSSSLSIVNFHLDEEEVDEDTWAEVNEHTPLYNKSKILAEKKAWDMVKFPPAGKDLELVTICPSLVLGKPLLKGEFFSGYMGSALMTGAIKKCPHVYFPIVDVEDVAQGHLLGITAPAGERYCLIENTYRLVDIGIAFGKEFKKYGYRSSEKELSYCMAKILSCCVSDIRGYLGIWGKRRHIRNDKSLKKLGLKKYKSLDNSTKEMGWAMIKLGMVPDKTNSKK